MSETARIVAFPAKHDRLLNKREAARELTISVRGLERLMQEGKIPSIKVRGQRRFHWSVICGIKQEGTG